MTTRPPNPPAPPGPPEASGPIPPDRLERELTALSEWPATQADAQVWKRALAAAQAEKPAAMHSDVWDRVLRNARRHEPEERGSGGRAEHARLFWSARSIGLTLTTSLAVIVGLTWYLSVPPGRSVRLSSRQQANPAVSELVGAQPADDVSTLALAGGESPAKRAELRGADAPMQQSMPPAQRFSGMTESAEATAARLGRPPMPTALPVPLSPGAPAAAIDLHARHVARQASIALRAPAMAPAVAAVAALVSDARGEFIESSAVSGSGPDATATFTLRVLAARFGETLAALRQLGDVASETASGDDVTDQAVDLDARIRNEEAVERELLALLEARRGSPLRDLLELREQVSRVRVNIEKLRAQADRLARRVGLATINVSVQVGPAAEKKPGGLLIDTFGPAWEQGTRRLAGAAAALVEWLLASLLWLVALGVCVPIGVGVARRLMRFSAWEPAPRV